MKRNKEQKLIADLEAKIVLLSGPRQVGKTTLSKGLFKNIQYLNFDAREDRKIINDQSWSRDVELAIFDEIHKKPRWKNWIKGIFDKEGCRPRLLLTGSAKLDVFKKGSDSLAGRYFSHRLHPLSIAELKSQLSAEECLERILKVGGFPEPFINGTEEYYHRWSRSHLDRILKEDILELEPIRRIKSVELLVDLLADRVGATTSYSSLARDLEVSPHTIKHWISVLESMFVIFVVTPFSKNIARSILKEPKIYFYDTARVKNDMGARLENAVACALLKDLHRKEDHLGYRCQLHYLRDREKREVDFLTIENKRPKKLIEVKLSDSTPASSLKYFSSHFAEAESIQLVKHIKNELNYENLRVVDVAKWLATLET